jgi:hypothetical protein
MRCANADTPTRRHADTFPLQGRPDYVRETTSAHPPIRGRVLFTPGSGSIFGVKVDQCYRRPNVYNVVRRKSAGGDKMPNTVTKMCYDLELTQGQGHRIPAARQCVQRNGSRYTSATILCYCSRPARCRVYGPLKTVFRALSKMIVSWRG